jgi:hypothetical protein
LGQRHEEKRPTGRPRRRQDNNKTNLGNREWLCNGLIWLSLVSKICFQ